MTTQEEIRQKLQLFHEQQDSGQYELIDEAVLAEYQKTFLLLKNPTDADKRLAAGYFYTDSMILNNKSSSKHLEKEIREWQKKSVLQAIAHCESIKDPVPKDFERLIMAHRVLGSIYLSLEKNKQKAKDCYLTASRIAFPDYSFVYPFTSILSEMQSCLNHDDNDIKFYQSLERLTSAKNIDVNEFRQAMTKIKTNLMFEQVKPELLWHFQSAIEHLFSDPEANGWTQVPTCVIKNQDDIQETLKMFQKDIKRRITELSHYQNNDLFFSRNNNSNSNNTINGNNNNYRKKK